MGITLAAAWPDLRVLITELRCGECTRSMKNSYDVFSRFYEQPCFLSLVSPADQALYKNQRPKIDPQKKNALLCGTSSSDPIPSKSLG